MARTRTSVGSADLRPIALPASLAVAATLLLVGALVVLADRSPAQSSPGDGTQLPADITALGSDVRTLDSAGMIGQDQALDVARGEYPEVFEKGRIESYLVALTDPMMPGFDDRPVWIVKATGLSLDVFSAPMLPNGEPAEVDVATRAYIYVDALTGEWLTATFRAD